MSRHAARFGLFALLALVAACDKVPLLAPTGSTVSLSISSTSVAGNGTAEVVATVIEAGGTPVHNGTEVTFQSSVGTVDPPVARTEGGVARATFRANNASGTARLVAFSGGAQSDEVEVRVGSAAAETVTVRAVPSSIPQNGGPVQVTATVRDVSGNPLAGAQVVFSADNGTLSSNSAVTDTNGEASVTLTTTRQTVVTASVADKEGETTINVASFPTATITLNPTTPVAGQTFQVTITPTVPSGGSPVQSIIVDFGDGTVRTLGSAGGAATVSHAYSRPGTYTINVTLVDAAGQRTNTSTVVTIQNAAVGVAVSASPSPATAGSPTTISASITNPNNVALTSVRFNFGDGGSVTQAVAGNASQVSTQHTYQSGGNYTVTATAIDANGNQYPGSTQLTVNPRAALQVTLDATPNENTGGSQFECSATYPKTCRTSFASFVPPSGGQPGVRVVFTAGITGALASPSSFEWDFGDGTTERTTSASVDHRYTAPGTYVIRVRVTTTDGNVGEQRLTLEIRP